MHICLEMASGTLKLLQKQTYDVLSSRYGTVVLAALTVLLIVSVLQFGEVSLSGLRVTQGAEPARDGDVDSLGLCYDISICMFRL